MSAPQAALGMTLDHPAAVLLGAQAGAIFLPACDHYSGVPERMTKSLELQRVHLQRFGTCAFDVTLDCEDGAPTGGEQNHARVVLALIQQYFVATPVPESDTPVPVSDPPSAGSGATVWPRIAVRLHAVDHPSFASDVRILVGGAAGSLCHVMIPKVETPADVAAAVAQIDAAGGQPGGAAGAQGLMLHGLIESELAVHNAFDIAAHPRVQSLSFGLMDFVSSHAGAIPDEAMGAQGQFSHPLVRRAKLEIAAACHAHGKVPSHCVVTEFGDTAALSAAAVQAKELGYPRMWSIHPAQIEPIVAALRPQTAEIDTAAALLAAAQAAQWAPTAFGGKLHDRASYRYYWQLLQKAHATGLALPAAARAWFGPASG